MFRSLHFLLWSCLMAWMTPEVICQGGKAFSRPICDNRESSTCVSFNPNPDPEPFAVLDKLGQLLDAQGNSILRLPPPPGQDDPLIDIVAKTVDIPKVEEGVFRVRTLKLERYFPKMDIGQVGSEYVGTDLEIIEWPGIMSDKVDGDLTTGVSYQDNLQQRLKDNFVPLSYEGDSSSFKNYVCNRRLGTHIRAMAFRPTNSDNPRFERYKPFYFAFGHRSFHRDFIQPLYAPVSQLNLLAEGHPDPECRAIDESNPFGPDSKLNHILAFTFSTNRLLFGMHCGIILIKPIDATANRVIAAQRSPDPNDDDTGSILRTDFKTTSSGRKYQRFIGRINRLSSNVCCTGVCQDMDPIAVAYSYNLKNTEENLKRIYVSFDHGESWDQKIVSASDTTFLKLIGSLYNRLDIPTPEFISRRIIKAKAQGVWGSDTDHVVNVIMGKEETKEAPVITSQDQSICAEIVSLQVIVEEKGFLALCRTDLGDPTLRKHPQGIQLNLNYAIFHFDISRYSPIIHGRMKSKRRLACTLRDGSYLDPNVKDVREPEIVMGRRGSNLIIVGCETILYHSINAGYTFWNAVFYVATEDGTYERRYQQPGFSFPLVAFDPDGISVTFTFGDNYAVGFISYTQEFRLLVGRVAATDGVMEDAGVCKTSANPCDDCKNWALEPPGCNKVKQVCLVTDPPPPPDCQPYLDTFIKFSTTRKFLPYYTNSGDIKFSVSVMHFLLENDNPNIPKYEHRKAIRLVDIPFKLTDAIRPFFEENVAVLDKSKGFRKCATYAFSVDTREASVDLGETTSFIASVEDNSPQVALGIFASLPDQLKIDVVKNITTRSGVLGQEMEHIWRVTIEPRGVPKDAMQSANLVLTNHPAQRCHTQPTSSVLVSLGCSGKKLVAHEDYNRPHCGKFFGAWVTESESYSTYQFRLEAGHYDPEMLRFWRKIAKDQDLFHRDGNDWVVHYDYKKYGCPIEPYRLENFVPDLRVLNLKENSNVTDTARGKPFMGQYILIEVFGQTGFSFLKTVKQAGCRRPPRNFMTLLREWKDRRRVLFEAFKSYKAFHPAAVADPQNIWQKSTHEPCEIPERKAADTADDLRIPEDDPYEVMQRGYNNAIVWDRRNRKEIYFFLAIDVDQQIDTFCDYTTFFAVTLNGEARNPPLHSILRFLLVFIFLIIMVILGYYIYRTLTQRGYEQAALLAKLERGAWEILLRYEKYLHEVENHGQDAVPDQASLPLSDQPKKPFRKPDVKKGGGPSSGKLKRNEPPKYSRAYIKPKK